MAFACIVSAFFIFDRQSCGHEAFLFCGAGEALFDRLPRGSRHVYSPMARDERQGQSGHSCVDTTVISLRRGGGAGGKVRRVVSTRGFCVVFSRSMRVPRHCVAVHCSLRHCERRYDNSCAGACTCAAFVCVWRYMVGAYNHFEVFTEQIFVFISNWRR